MNWDAVGAIGEVLGAVVVVVTIGYLAVQVRQARREVQRSIAQARAQAVRDLMLTRATDERLGKLYVKATLAMANKPPAFVAHLAETTGLSLDEAAALYWEQLAWWQYRLEMIPYADELPTAARMEFEAGIRQHYGGQPVEGLFYENAKATLPPEAVAYIDRVLATKDD